VTRKHQTRINRRVFLKCMFGGGALVAAHKPLLLYALEPAKGVQNPLNSYPDRNWEALYRDLYQADSSFYFVCTPNDTHNCYLKAEVKNGVITRVGPSQNYHKATDLYGTACSQRWDPRVCNKGTALPRRFYGDRRVKGAFIRKGFKTWVDKGFPRDPDGLPPGDLFRRGEDEYEKVSWGEAYRIAAKALYHTAATYSGSDGAERLKQQDYDPAMINKMGGAGTRALKFRGGMPVLGSIKLFGLYRFANSMALADAKIRRIEPDEAKGGTGFDNYSWHTDLPPGHPMVCGQQTVDFDLCDTEYCNVLIAWGMNWICTKMPDAHWLTEARIKGKKVINITTDYNATSSKSDEVVVIRPGTDPALALGIAHILIKEKLYDEDFVKHFTDLPLLVRMDTGKMLKASDIFADYQPKKLERTKVVKDTKDLPKPADVDQPHSGITEAMREAWNDFVLWDTKSGGPVAVSRDEVGKYAAQQGWEPALEGSFEVNIGGKEVRLETVFSLTKKHLMDTWTPAATEKITWAPQSAIYSLARTFAANPEKVLTAVGMGPNQMFNADQKDRAIFLVAALTRNVGFFGGNVGSYAGNYRAAYFNGMPQYIAEDPFNITKDPEQPAKLKPYFGLQSAHFYAHTDQPLKVHGHYFTGDTHMPTPTKSLWFAGSNSILGNAKGHYEVVMNLLRHPQYRAKNMHKRMIECVFVNEWWWTGSCEYADIVFGADSWGEYHQNDMTQSCTNPFMQVMPLTEIKRIHDTRADAEIYKGVAAELAKLTGDERFNDYWMFINDQHRAKPYIQRVLDHSNMFKGYEVTQLLELAKDGIPAMMMSRTYPKFIGHEQSSESAPWYTKSGRLEFLRDEPEFVEYGESLVLYREPVDSTFYTPNAIVARPHPLIKPKTPQDYGFSPTDMEGETLQVRNEVLTPEELLQTKHPLMAPQYGHTHIWVTPKYRHSVHTFWADLDILSVFWGPFGDMYRKDKRKPWVGEGYIDMNPHDAKRLGIEDGDYIWVDADPRALPFKGWQERPEEYKIARCMLRARYYPGMPKNVTRTWFHLPGASFGSVRGAAQRQDGQAKNPATNYQAMYRFGSHQSGTRSWLRPTLLTDSLVRKDLMGQTIGTGFAPDVHCANGAPRESFVKFTKAEDGGENGTGLWSRAKQGDRPGYETQDMKTFIAGGFVS
jgi:nitrate reductase alpha subunit